MTWNRTHTTAGECRDNNPGTKSTPTLYSTFQQITRKHKLTITEIRGRLYVEISPSQGWEWETANGIWNRNREYPGFVILSEPKILRLVLLT